MGILSKQTASMISVLWVTFSVLGVAFLSIFFVNSYFNLKPSIPLIEDCVVIKTSVEECCYSISIKDISNWQEFAEKEILINSPKQKNSYIVRVKLTKETNLRVDEIEVNANSNWVKEGDGFYYLKSSIAENSTIPFACGLKLNTNEDIEKINVISQAFEIEDENVQELISEKIEQPNTL